MIETERHGEVIELRLARPPVNALSPALMSRLNAEWHAAEQAGARAIVVSGQPGMFSAGLDVRELSQLSAEALRRFLGEFFRLMERIARSPVPSVMALTGHCPAGGTVLAIFADHRVMSRGAFRIGLNEVQVGLYPGATIWRAFERLVGPRRGADLLMRGALIDPEAAFAAGLVDELADSPAAARQRAIAHAQSLLALPPNAFRRTRALVRADLVALFDESQDRALDQMLQFFVGEEAQRAMQAVLARG